MAILALITGAVVYALLPVDGVIPVYRLNMVNAGTGSKGVVYSPFQPARINAPALTAVDARQRIYLVTRRTDGTGLKPLVQVTRIDDSHSTVASPVVLTQLHAGPLRESCACFAVSPSGKRWWTIRLCREGQGRQPDYTSILTVYNEDGRALQEWSLPFYLASIYELYTPDEQTAVVQIEGEQRYQCTLTRATPLIIRADGDLGDWMAPDGIIWGIRIIASATDAHPINLGTDY